MPEKPNPVVIDLGKKNRKSVKQLRKGQGKLMDKLQDTVQELCTNGTLEKDVQQVIVIVESKPKADWATWM